LSRSPGTGLYDNLQKYNLPHPTAVFEIDYFKGNPAPFYMLAKELYPGNFKPTAVHFFIKLLHDKGLLLRNFTQNIDTLERVAGIPEHVMVEAHGSFAVAHCISCKKEFSHEFIKQAIFSNNIPKCECGSLIKPDIVFFGEALPSRFFTCVEEDLPVCDLLIVIGTSLQVQPFASLISRVSDDTPRLLINNEQVGKGNSLLAAILGKAYDGFAFGEAHNYRDMFWLGDCQDGVKYFAELLGWKKELEDLIANFKPSPAFT